LQAKHSSQAEHQARLLQQQIFDVMQGQLNNLKKRLKDKVAEDSYLDRFSSLIWHNLLMTVRTTVRLQFQGTLARFNTEIPNSYICKATPVLPQDLG
jgi:hypothetical protein